MGQPQQSYSDLPPGARVAYSDLPPGAIVAAPTQSSAQRPVVAPTGNTISGAPAPGIMDRLRGVVANSAVGHALEEGLPKVADALNLHPTETVNSPTYESDKGQVLAPQYLVPGTPTSKAGNVGKGVLQGVGQLTSGRNIAIGTGIAATGGLMAPAATGTGLVAQIARAGAQGARAGMAVVGAKGVYDDGQHAYGQYQAGDTAGALQSVGAALPNAALTLPALGTPIEDVGDAAQARGVDLMDSYLKAGKKAYRYGAEPGRGILDEGPGTSIGLTRQSFSDKVAGAKSEAGAAIPQAVNASTAQIPRSELADNVNSVIDSKRAVLSGPGGKIGRAHV